MLGQWEKHASKQTTLEQCLKSEPQTQMLTGAKQAVEVDEADRGVVDSGRAKWGLRARDSSKDDSQLCHKAMWGQCCLTLLLFEIDL